MTNKSKFINSVDIAEELGVSVSHGYKIIKRLNDELKSMGYMVVSGRVARTFFEEKFYGVKEVIDASL